MFYLILFMFGLIFCEAKLRVERLRSWDYINLHCRDDDNAPVDWWILYKPPSGKLSWEAGQNFSYITAADAGKWIPSNRAITGNSMLKHTLAPIFRRTYQNHLAVATYSPKPAIGKRAGSAAMGLLLADELSGVWITHTVPGFPDITGDRLHFPADELKYGHMVLCLSADFVTLNELAKRLREVEPHVLSLRVPDSVKKWLPNWLPMSQPIKMPLNDKLLPKTFAFVTKDKTLHVEVMLRRPGDKRCLYQIFAKTHNLVLDVYGHYNRTATVCEKKYSIRKIDAISLNYPNHINDDTKYAQVVYVNNQTDRVEFAVSTAAHWQRSGGILDPEYWACIGSSAADASGKGGLILCIENYLVWRSFDILKIKEPEC